MNLNKEQIEAIAAGEGAWNVMSTAGSGKTEVLVRRAKRLLNEGASPDDLLLVTFTREAASNIATRLGVKFTKDQRGGPRTFHSFCLNLIRREARFLPFGLSANPFPEGPALYKLLLEAMKKNGLRRKNYEEAKAFISRCKRQRISPEQACEDPLTDHLFARTYSTYESMLREGGMLDFDSMMVEAVNILEKHKEVRERWQFKWILVDEAQDTDDLQFRLLQLLWMAHGNIFVVGDYCQCQPAGTKVLMLDTRRSGSRGATFKTVDIAEIRDGDETIAWTSHGGQRTFNIPRKVKTASRWYKGELVRVSSDVDSTRVTPEHQMWVRFNKAGTGKHIVYLMYREDLGFRIGITKLKRNGPGKRPNCYGLIYRLGQEKAEKGWILAVCETRQEAENIEEIDSVKYGIPDSVFEPTWTKHKSAEHIKKVFDCADPMNGYRCLSNYNLRFEHPIATRNQGKSWRGYFKTAACNVLPNLMDIPLFGINKFTPIVNKTLEIFDGMVYSLEVEKNHTYIADGLVVGNCLYGFRGANPENLVHFTNWFPGARTIILPENFRSTLEIVEYSKKNAPIDNQLTRNIRTSNPRSGVPIEFRMYAGPAEEAEATLSAASADPGHSAILARTNNQLGLFETLALQHNIKFHRLGKSGFWNQPEVNMLVNLAAFCMGTKAPAKYSETLIDPYRRALRTLPPEGVLLRIIQEARLENLYSNEDFSDDENFAINNLYTVAGIAKRFRTLQEFLNHARKAAHASRKAKNAVTLATIHAAKGLEWDNVFVVGMERGKLPHEKGTLAEEKRIWYVARTRPRKRLRVSFAGTPSDFLADDLTPEIQRELRKHAETVEKIQRQQELFAK